MSVKKIKQYNQENFLRDIKSVRDVLVYPEGTGDYFRVKKKDILKSAETATIKYYISDKIFVVKRNAMVIV